MIQIITTITQHGRHIEHVTDITGPAFAPATPNERKLASAVMHAAFKALTYHSEAESSKATIVEFDKPQRVVR